MKTYHQLITDLDDANDAVEQTQERIQDERGRLAEVTWAREHTASQIIPHIDPIIVVKALGAAGLRRLRWELDNATPKTTRPDDTTRPVKQTDTISRVMRSQHLFQLSTITARFIISYCN